MQTVSHRFASSAGKTQNPQPVCLRKGGTEIFIQRVGNQRYCQTAECLREVHRWQAALRQQKVPQRVMTSKPLKTRLITPVFPKNTAFLLKPRVFSGFLCVNWPWFWAALICTQSCNSVQTCANPCELYGTTDGSFFPAFSGTSPV
jgi:hypothetical protein